MIRRTRPLLFLVLLVVAWAYFEYLGLPPNDPTEPERVSELFVRCDAGGAYACVVDGDTFRLGKRKIRIRGIDAPEVSEKARCPKEAQMGDAAIERLLDLLNDAPFVMTGRANNSVDQYGRELRNLESDGGRDIGEVLIREGLVRKYRGRKESWC